MPPAPKFDLHVLDQAVQLSEGNPLLVFYFPSMSAMAPKITVGKPPGPPGSPASPAAHLSRQF